MAGRPAGGIYPFRAWRRRLNLTPAEASKLLDCSERSIASYDKAAELPRDLLLAMLALEYLPSWRLADLGITPYWRNKV